MTHIVEYDGPKGCHNCKFLKNDEDDYPCDECLAEPIKDDGKVPIHWIASEQYLAEERKKEQQKNKKKKNKKKK